MHLDRDKLSGLVGIYCIRNIINNKVYIGSSIDCYKRLSGHIRLLNRNKSKSPHLQRAWNKYGQDSFVCVILEKCEEENLLIRESFYIDKYTSYNDRFGYNIVKNPHRPSMTTETKKKQSQAVMGEKNHMFGKKWPQEYKTKMSKIHRRVKRFTGIPVICNETGIAYANMSEAARDMGLNKNKIGECIRGNQNSHKGYTFTRYSGDIQCL